ncbi:MAG: hypothetical protein ACPLZ9_06540, partial [Candidatus Ratteibacteria bacterium]
ERERQEEIKRRQKERERKEEELKKKQEEIQKRRLLNKQNLLQFIKHKNHLNKLEREKAFLYNDIISYKKSIEREKQLQLIEITKKIKEERKKLLLEKRKKPPIKEEKPKLEEIKVKKPSKEEVIKKKEEQQKIKAYISCIFKTATETVKQLESQLNDTEKNIANFIQKTKKEIKEKKVPKVLPEKAKIILKEKVKVGVYKEPFKFGPFLRRNIFKFVFIALLIAWFIELFMYIKKLISPEERLKLIVGETLETRPTVEKKKEIKEEEEKLVYYTKEKINIEGKRDPFSTGRLTMEIMKKPIPTNIIYAKRPEVISIIKTQKFVSILKPEEKITSSEIPSVPKVSSIEKPSITKLSPLEKPSISKPEPLASSAKISEIEKVPEVKITPFVAPEKECKLIYRGRMILEGVEYFFIEGE